MSYAKKVMDGGEENYKDDQSTVNTYVNDLHSSVFSNASLMNSALCFDKISVSSENNTDDDTESFIIISEPGAVNISVSPKCESEFEGTDINKLEEKEDLACSMRSSVLSCIEPELHAGICKEHGSWLLFFCKNCKFWICRDCTVINHTQDKSCIVASIKSELERMVRDIDYSCTANINTLNKLNEKLKNSERKLEDERITTEKSVYSLQNYLITLAQKKSDLEKQIQECERRQITFIDLKNELKEVDTLDKLSFKELSLGTYANDTREWISKVLEMSALYQSKEDALPSTVECKYLQPFSTSTDTSYQGLNEMTKKIRILEADNEDLKVKNDELQTAVMFERKIVSSQDRRLMTLGKKCQDLERELQEQMHLLDCTLCEAEQNSEVLRGELTAAKEGYEFLTSAKKKFMEFPGNDDSGGLM